MMQTAFVCACVGVGVALGMATVMKLVGVILVALTCIQMYFRFIVYKAWPSHPLMFPLIGHAFFFNKFKKFVLSESKRPEGLFLIWSLGYSPYLVVVNPQAAKKVLGDSTTFPKGPDYVNKFSTVFGNGLVTSVGEAHSRARRLLGRFFVKQTLEQHVPAIRSETLRFMRLVKGTMDVRQFFHLMTLQVFYRTQLNVDPYIHGTEKDEFPLFLFKECLEPGEKHLKEGVWPEWMAAAYARGQTVLSEHILWGLPVLPIFPGTKKVLDTVKSGHSYFQKLIDHRRASKNPPDDCLTALLDLPDQEIKEQLVTLIGAGHDTTAYFLSYTVFCLAKYPHVQDALRKELLGDDFDWPSSLLKRVLQEVLRIYAVIPQVSRIASKNTYLPSSTGENLFVPKGANILVPMYVTNRLESVWGDDASEFNPDRWIGQVRSDGLMNSKLGFFPFGYGSRTCIGYNLSLVETQAILTELLYRFEFLPVTDSLPPLFIGISLVVTDPKGIQVSFKDRALN